MCQLPVSTGSAGIRNPLGGQVPRSVTEGDGGGAKWARIPSSASAGSARSAKSAAAVSAHHSSRFRDTRALSLRRRVAVSPRRSAAAEKGSSLPTAAAEKERVTPKVHATKQRQ